MTLVVKLGGSLDIGDSLVEELASWDEPLVVVHGGHRVMDELAASLGHPPRMVTSESGETARYTDTTAMDEFLMAYCGLANKRLVERLRRAGADAVGMSALDGGIATGRRREHLRVVENGRRRVLRDNYTGSIDAVDPSLLRLLLDSGRLPVICPPALSTSGEAINVDGDRLAAEIAIALGADRLLLLMDRPGVLRDAGDDTTLIPRLRLSELERALAHMRDRGRVKLHAARRALEGGVAAVGLASGHGVRPLGAAGEGGGTWLTR